MDDFHHDLMPWSGMYTRRRTLRFSGRYALACAMGRRLIFCRQSDTYADDVPYWQDVPAEKDSPSPEGMLMVPYSYDVSYPIVKMHMTNVGKFWSHEIGWTFWTLWLTKHFLARTLS